nr:MAG TPA: hypothetical protein [Caudoviricetes sp.]
MFFRVRFDIMKMNFFRKLYFDTGEHPLHSDVLLCYVIM